jgi:hypothetical protein
VLGTEQHLEPVTCASKRRRNVREFARDGCRVRQKAETPSEKLGPKALRIEQPIEACPQ